MNTLCVSVCDVCRFGGGPEVRFLRQCPSCLRVHEALVRRQCHEMNAFITVSYTTLAQDSLHVMILKIFACDFVITQCGRPKAAVK